jgi:CheY-like chemotaxis protein
MKAKAPTRKNVQSFPLEKSDIRYDPASQEVSMKRGKFDAFVGYTRGLVEQLEAAEDARDVAQYRARKAEKTADVLQMLTDVVFDGTRAVREWLKSPDNSIRELSERTGIPYATCHRIVNERFGTPNLEVGFLGKMLSAISRGRGAPSGAKELRPRFQRVLIGVPEGEVRDDMTCPWAAKGSKVATASAGTEIAKMAEEMHADLILVDVTMPELGKNNLEQLRQIAQSDKTMVVLTGEIAKANSALLPDVPKKLHGEEREAETMGG